MQIQNFYNYRGTPKINSHVNEILENPELDNPGKMRELLGLQFLRTQVGAQGNFKLIEFFCQKDNLETLLQYSVAVPTDPERKDDSYKFPNVAQELLCHSSMIAQALVEGGWQPKEEEKAGSEDDDEREPDDEDSDKEPDAPKPKLAVNKLMNKARQTLSLAVDDDDEDQKESAATHEVISDDLDERADEADQALPDHDISDAQKALIENNLSPDTKKEVGSSDGAGLTISAQSMEAPETETEEAEAPTTEETGDSDAVKVSDVFLNLENKQPTYITESDETAEKEPKEEKKTDDDDDDFEREDDFEANVVDEDDDAKDDEEKVGKTVKLKVNINVTNINAKKSIKKEPKKPVNTTALLDTLFAFIGSNSVEPEADLNTTQSKLNLFTNITGGSRATAGTTDKMPGDIIPSSGRSNNFYATSEKNVPELLPVSCGYFFNIVRQLLLKQRKMMLRYILLHSEGKVFDSLVKYIKYHSLADLLQELMGVSIGFQAPPSLSRASNSGSDKDDSDGEQKKAAAPQLTEDQMKMKSVLEAKRREVVNKLVNAMSHQNRDDMEASLNASTLLIDLIDQENRGGSSALGIFMEDDGKIVGRIVELATDPSNGFNQQYLLAVLLALTKALKPSSNTNNLFKDLDEENEDSDSAAKGPSPQAQNFDLTTQNSQNLVIFLNNVSKNSLLYNLLITINTGDLDPNQGSYVNQQNVRVKKIGLTRLRSLELVQQILSLLHPSLGVLASAQQAMQAGRMPEHESENGFENFEPIQMRNFLSMGMRRQVVKTMLLVIRDYGYCSIACQLCIMILDTMKTMFDVIDIVQLQKFVIQEFRERHQHLYDQHTKNRESGSNQAVKRYQINHLNMQSAQVNQMTNQLKEKVSQIQTFYCEGNREMAAKITGSSLTYEDLISSEDQEFWQYLCKKDFRRLNKLLTQNIGEGYFIDDSGEEDSDDDGDNVLGANRNQGDSSEDDEDESGKGVNVHRRKRGGNQDEEENKGGDSLADDDDDFDHDNFMEKMLSDMHVQQEDDEARARELEDQIKREEADAARKVDEKKAKFTDNNFWRTNSEEQFDIDDLMQDME